MAKIAMEHETEKRNCTHKAAGPQICCCLTRCGACPMGRSVYSIRMGQHMIDIIVTKSLAILPVHVSQQATPMTRAMRLWRIGTVPMIARSINLTSNQEYASEVRRKLYTMTGIMACSAFQVASLI